MSLGLTNPSPLGNVKSPILSRYLRFLEQEDGLLLIAIVSPFLNSSTDFIL